MMIVQGLSPWTQKLLLVIFDKFCSKIVQQVEGLTLNQRVVDSLIVTIVPSGIAADRWDPSINRLRKARFGRCMEGELLPAVRFWWIQRQRECGMAQTC